MKRYWPFALAILAIAVIMLMALRHRPKIAQARRPAATPVAATAEEPLVLPAEFPCTFTKPAPETVRRLTPKEIEAGKAKARAKHTQEMRGLSRRQDRFNRRASKHHPTPPPPG